MLGSNKILDSFRYLHANSGERLLDGTSLRARFRISRRKYNRVYAFRQFVHFAICLYALLSSIELEATVIYARRRLDISVVLCG
jgi:hypothetical protein